MRVVRLRDMWLCVMIWLLLDLAMIVWSADLPDWVAFDGKKALAHDSWTIFFILWMWIGFSYRAHPRHDSPSVKKEQQEASR